MVDGDIKEDANRREADDKARASVRDEWERHAGERREPHDGAHVDGSLAAHERRQADREPLSEWIAAAERDVEAGVREERKCGDDAERADEAELLSDDREDHVRRGLREVVDLLDTLPQADAEDST